MDSLAKQDAWIVLITATVLCMPFILSYVFLAKRFPGMTLIEIFKEVYGRIACKFVSGMYILFFILIFCFNLRDLSDFYTEFIMPETPGMMFIIVFILVAAYALKKGIQIVAKLSFIGCALTFAAVVFTFLLLLGKMDFRNFLPVFEIPAKLLFSPIYTLRWYRIAR
jgi:spore germination protein KB